MSLTNRHWQASTDSRFAAYLVYDTTILVFKNVKGKSDAADMFGDITNVSSKRQPHQERLPFTLEALKRRKEYGRDVPEWLKDNL